MQKIPENNHSKYISNKNPTYLYSRLYTKFKAWFMIFCTGPQTNQDGENNKMAANLTIIMYKNIMKNNH